MWIIPFIFSIFVIFGIAIKYGFGNERYYNQQWKESTYYHASTFPSLLAIITIQLSWIIYFIYELYLK